jgi:hypothetical protein
VCWITDQKIDSASRCLHSCMHCGEAQGDTMELACTACCTTRGQSSVDEFRSQDFGLKLNCLWDRTWCILFCLQNGTLTRPASTRFVIGLQSPVPLCAGRSLWRRLDLVMSSSHNILTLDALQVCLGPR